MIIEVKHHFDAAHRLPALPGKCQSLHGHTWHVAARFEGTVDDNGIVADFGLIKMGLRHHIDLKMDHGTMLGPDDALLPLLEGIDGCKVLVMAPWPTVETVAKYLGYVCQILAHSEPGLEVVSVRVDEGSTNAAIWTPGEQGEL